jgi:hypothetical protein
MPVFTGPRPVFAVLGWLSQEIADADAAFQITQQRDWNRIAGRPLVEGFDRLANLGVTEVRVTVRLTAIRPPWYRRLWNRLWRLQDELAYRFHVKGDGSPALVFRATVARDTAGRWTAALDRDRRAERQRRQSAPSAVARSPRS